MNNIKLLLEESRALLNENADFMGVFDKYRDKYFPSYADLRDYVVKTSNDKWNMRELEAAIGMIDIGKTLKGGIPRVEIIKDRNVPLDQYIHIMNGDTKLINRETLTLELLKFAGRNGNPLNFLF